MNIYQYWPHPHREANPLCLALLRPGDALTVQALGSHRGEVFGDVQEYEVVRDLPDPTAVSRQGLGRFTARPRIAIGRVRARRRLVRARPFDVLHLTMLDYHYNWADLPSLHAVAPVVSHVHDVRPHASLFPGRAETALLRATYARAGHLVVYHRTLRDELVADFGIDPARVHTIPIAFDPHDQTDPAVDRPERPVVLFFGTLRENKGIGVLLDALEDLGPGRPVDVVIAGEGSDSMYRRIEERASRLGIRFDPGYASAERKRELYSAASCVVVPYTEFHSQSAVLADAYTFRVPVVVTDVGALGATVRDDGTGVVIAAGDPGALAAALADPPLRGDPSLARALDEVAARHAPAVVGRRLREIYDVVVEDGPDACR